MRVESARLWRRLDYCVAIAREQDDMSSVHHVGMDETSVKKGHACSMSDWKPAKRRQKATDATWTAKHGKSFFGYELSINVDKEYKIIRAPRITCHSCETPCITN